MGAGQYERRYLAMSIFNNEEYENLYPTREEVLGIANDDSEEDSDD